jgi:hypothetical protein
VKQGTRAEVSLHIDASPDSVYDLVTDVTRMGEWSPETTRCRWLDSATGPVVGARFKGTNRRLMFRWSTKPRVVAANRGREFAFVVNLIIFGREMTKWTYAFEQASDNGTDVTESFEMLDDLPWYIAFSQRLMGIADRKANLEAGMQRTLERIKAVAEGGN